VCLRALCYALVYIMLPYFVYVCDLRENVGTKIVEKEVMSCSDINAWQRLLAFMNVPRLKVNFKLIGPIYLEGARVYFKLVRIVRICSYF